MRQIRMNEKKKNILLQMKKKKLKTGKERMSK